MQMEARIIAASSSSSGTGTCPGTPLEYSDDLLPPDPHANTVIGDHGGGSAIILDLDDDGFLARTALRAAAQTRRPAPG
jgi:hypothetical protein